MFNTLKQIHLFSSTLVFLTICCVSPALAGDYLNSSHGKTTIGVNRSSTSLLGYTQGNCGHCHEQHATGLAGGPYNYALFTANSATIASPPVGLCFKCHNGSATTQTPAFKNYSYSYRAGNYGAGSPPDNISDFFDSSQVASYHHLDDILTFISTDATVSSWNYTADSNPCAACHNPHAAQGDPEDNSITANPKSSTTRGWPLSRPSQHASDPWPLWGDGAAERMNTYNYQAPYRVGSATYEPDADPAIIINGSNLTNFVAFCTDCHKNAAAANDLNTNNSSLLARPLLPIDWTAGATGEKHGGVITTGSFCGDAPYGTTTNRVLSCMDCHESHGSPNAYILRPEVNGAALGGAPLAVGTPGPTPIGGPGNGATLTWSTLCNSCHQDDNQIAGAGTCASTDTWFIVHHDTTATACSADAPIDQTILAQADCALYCHTAGPAGAVGPWSCADSTSNAPGLVPPIPCDGCHYHGATYTVPNPPGSGATHTTF